MNTWSQSLTKTVLSILLALAVVMVSIPKPAHAAQTCVAWYTVREGDTTPRIAHTFGLRWRKIAQANDLEYPYRLKCIPPEDFTPAKKKTKETVSVSVVNNLISVSASGFAKKAAFYVKVRDITSTVGGWHKIGQLKVKRKTAKTGYYILPKELRGSIYLQVCLKNATTDEKICRTVLHIYK